MLQIVNYTFRREYCIIRVRGGDIMCNGNCSNCKSCPREEKTVPMEQLEILNDNETVMQYIKDKKILVGQSGVDQMVIIGVDQVTLANGQIINVVMQQQNLITGDVSVGTTNRSFLRPTIDEFLDRDEENFFVVNPKETMNEDFEEQVQKAIDNAVKKYENAAKE